MFTCGPPFSKLSPQTPGSLEILALAALLRPVSPHALALSLALSIGGVLGGGTLRFLQPSRCSLQLSFWLGSWGPFQFYLHFRRTLGACSGTFGAPPTGCTLHTSALLQSSHPFPRPVVPHVPALLLALLTCSPCSLANDRGVPVQSGSSLHPG